VVAIALPKSTLSSAEMALIDELTQQIHWHRPRDIRMEQYYEGRQRLAVLGLAVPPELAGFETVINWPRVTVDEVERRLDIRAFVRPGALVADDSMRNAYEANNLDSEAALLHRDVLMLGRGFASVSTNPEDAESPLILVESAREIAVLVDPVRRRIRAGLRLYRTPNAFVMFDQGTLMLPDATIHIERMSGGSWKVRDRDDHMLGRVALQMFLNRRRTGQWHGESEMTDVIPITDAAARSMTNLQLAQETHAVPNKYAIGISKGDFVDKDGNQLPVWEAYFDAFMATANKDAKIGQLPSSDLSNFTNTMDFYGRMCSSVTGLPTRYFGQSTVNPAGEGAIRADESRLIKNAERKQGDLGNNWGSLMSLWLRFKTGEWTDGNRVSTLWFDAGTPTFAQKADALQKLAGGRPLISQEGAWDELGWSEPRKDRERAYFAKEASDALELGVQAAANALDQ